jgi:hypothetical protein
MLEGLVLTNLRTTDRYFPGLMSVLFSGASPEEAIKRVHETPK